MEQTNKIKINRPAANTRKFDTSQTDVWAPERENNHMVDRHPSDLLEYVSLNNKSRTLGELHACKIPNSAFGRHELVCAGLIATWVKRRLLPQPH